MIPAMIVPILTRPELLHRLLSSIDYPVRHLVIIDNGGVLPLGQQVVENVQRTSVIHMPANLGVSGSWNLGFKAAPLAPWWLVVNSDAHFPAGSLARFDNEASRGALTLSGGAPEWCAFALGDEALERVGLFDEMLHPAYWEDDDWLRRADAAGVPVVHSGIPVHHDNSSTLAAGYQRHNEVSYPANAAYYADKVAREDYGPGGWSLERRRALSWD